MFKWLNPEARQTEAPPPPPPEFVDKQIKGKVLRKARSNHGRYGPCFHFLIEDEISGKRVTFTLRDCAEAALVREDEILDINYVFRTKYQDITVNSVELITE